MKQIRFLKHVTPYAKDEIVTIKDNIAEKFIEAELAEEVLTEEVTDTEHSEEVNTDMAGGEDVSTTPKGKKLSKNTTN